jgi:hypothetical protein
VVGVIGCARVLRCRQRRDIPWARNELPPRGHTGHVLFAVGQEVMCSVLKKTPWGLLVQIDHAPDQGASIDLFREGYWPKSESDFPAVGTRLKAIVTRVSRGYVHLRPEHPPEPLPAGTDRPRGD